MITGIDAILVQNAEIHNSKSSIKIQLSPARHDLFKVDHSAATSTLSKTQAEESYYSRKTLPGLDESNRIEAVVGAKEWKYRKFAR